MIEYGARDQKLLMIAACTGVFIMPLIATMMNISLISISHEFDIGSKKMAMVNTVYILGTIITMVPIAKLADIVGRKKILFVGLTIISASLLLSAISISFDMLLVLRLIGGIGGAMLSVVFIAMITDAFPSNRRGWAIGLYTTSIYLGLATGPSIGGIVNDLLGWRSLFLFAIPFIIISVTALVLLKKENYPNNIDKMDVPGAILYVFSISAVILGLIYLPRMWAILLLITGLILSIIFIRVMGHRNSPVLNIEIFKHKTFTKSCVASFMSYSASYSVSFFLALYLQTIGGMSATHVGIIIFIQPLIQVTFTAKMGALSDKMYNKNILPTIGLILVSIGIIMILCYSTQLNIYLVYATMITIGFGFAMFSAPNNSTIMSSVPSSDRGEASGIMALSRQIGKAVSMSIAMCTITVIMGSIDNLNPSRYENFINVMQISFAICLIVCIIGIIISWRCERYAEN